MWINSTGVCFAHHVVCTVGVLVEDLYLDEVRVPRVETAGCTGDGEHPRSRRQHGNSSYASVLWYTAEYNRIPLIKSAARELARGAAGNLLERKVPNLAPEGKDEVDFHILFQTGKGFLFELVAPWRVHH